MENINMLEGVTIIDMSIAESGPVCTHILAMLGATVIHIDPVNNRQANRYFGYIIRASNKRCITLDCKAKEGKEVLRKLLAKADVFYENFAPGAVDRLGFSYEEAKKINPEIIYVSLKGFGSKSDWSECITFDPVSCASGGSAYICGYEDFLPMLSGINIGDSGAGIQSALSVVAAILYKKITGKGQYVETPMQNAVVLECRHAFSEYYATGKVRRAGNSYRGLKPTAPHNIYKTQGYDHNGNYICISCSADEDSPDFANLCKAMGREDLLNDPRYATPALRYENRLSLDAEITKWTLRRSKEDALQILAYENGINAGAVMSLEEVLNDDFMVGNVIKHIEDPKAPGLMPTLPISFSGKRVTPITPLDPGSANEEIYCGLLGISKEEIKELREKKVI